MDAQRSETGSIETDIDRGAVLALLEDGTRIPEWAPAFAEVAVAHGDGWLGTRDGKEFPFRVAVQRDAGTVDYLRPAPPGPENGAFIRVVPRIGGGNVIAMTLPVRPGMTAADVRETLAAELAAIERLARS